MISLLWLLSACSILDSVSGPPELAVLSPAAGQIVRPGEPVSVHLRYAVFTEGAGTLSVDVDGGATQAVSGFGEVDLSVPMPDAPGAAEVPLRLVDADGRSTSVRVPVEIAVRPGQVPDRCVGPDWAVPDARYRKLLWTRVWAGQERKPVSIDVDFAAEYAALGDDAPFDPTTLHVIEHRCDGTSQEIAVQWSDELVALLERKDHRDPAGDGRGSVSFVPAPGAPAKTATPLVRWYALYFGGDPVREQRADITASRWVATNNKVTLAFDERHGHAIQNFGPRYASYPVMSLSSSCCGNGVQTSRTGPDHGWSPTAAAAEADHKLIEDGPVFAAWRTSGVVDQRDRDLHPFAYEFRTTTLLFADSSEVWMSVWQQGLTDVRNDHAIDPALGFRPFEAKAYYGAPFARRRSHGDIAGVVESGETWTTPGAVGFGYYNAPLYPAPIGNPAKLPNLQRANGRYVFLAGNDAFDLGQTEAITIPAGTVWFDEVGVMLQAWSSFGEYRANAFVPMLKPVTVSVEGSERRPDAG
jgi:hypothetical protein